jgi:hypothetical protein
MMNLAKALVTAALVASAAISPVRAEEVSFLEAALFFITAVEPTVVYRRSSCGVTRPANECCAEQVKRAVSENARSLGLIRAPIG